MTEIDTTPAWTPPSFCECWAFPAGALCSYCQLARRRAGQEQAAVASHDTRERAERSVTPLSKSEWDRLEQGQLWNAAPNSTPVRAPSDHALAGTA